VSAPRQTRRGEANNAALRLHLAVIARRKNQPTIPLAEVKASLRRNGALRR